MATPNSNLAGEADGSAGLSVDDVTKIIATAKSAAADPVSVGMQIFSGLGDNATVSGSTLRQALSAAAIPTAGPLDVLLNGIQSISKAGSIVSVTNGQQVQIALDGTPVRLKNAVSFGVAQQDGLPALQNITGVSVHKVFWIDIHTIQLTQNHQGQKVVRVVTADGSRDIPLA